MPRLLAVFLNLRAVPFISPRETSQAYAVSYDQPLGEVTRAISNEAVRLIADYTGRGPTKARTVVSGDWVFITLQDVLTKGERRLADSGHHEAVLASRKSYQEAMRTELEATVTRHLGRRVVAFMSENHIEPDVAVEIFLLEANGGEGNGLPVTDGNRATSEAV